MPRLLLPCVTAFSMFANAFAPAPAAADQQVSALLSARLRRIESAFRERDANLLRLSFSTAGKVRVELRDFAVSQSAYGPGQLQVIFAQIFEDSRTREFSFAKEEIRVAASNTAFARGRWVHMDHSAGKEVVDSLTFTLREERGDWRIQEIRSSR